MCPAAEYRFVNQVNGAEDMHVPGVVSWYLVAEQIVVNGMVHNVARVGRKWS